MKRMKSLEEKARIKKLLIRIGAGLLALLMIIGIVFNADLLM
ncbi:hypothetical protein FACS189499_00120 [Clostridia bacterium]|nr:hypothetical protein FACS189499_00120 [Clostridia bacterium]